MCCKDLFTKCIGGCGCEDVSHIFCQPKDTDSMKNEVQRMKACMP